MITHTQTVLLQWRKALCVSTEGSKLATGQAVVGMPWKKAMLRGKILSKVTKKQA